MRVAFGDTARPLVRRRVRRPAARAHARRPAHVRRVGRLVPHDPGRAVGEEAEPPPPFSPLSFSCFCLSESLFAIFPQ